MDGYVETTAGKAALLARRLLLLIPKLRDEIMLEAIEEERGIVRFFGRPKWPKKYTDRDIEKYIRKKCKKRRDYEWGHDRYPVADEFPHESFGRQFAYCEQLHKIASRLPLDKKLFISFGGMETLTEGVLCSSDLLK